MNIFFLDTDSVESAWMYCDQHLGKIRLEISQLLSTCIHLNKQNSILIEDKYQDFAHHAIINDKSYPLYKKTHINHPLNVWVRESKKNFNWALSHLTMLNEIWKDNGFKGTKTDMVIKTFETCLEYLTFPIYDEMTPIKLCMDIDIKEEFGVLNNHNLWVAEIEKAVMAYRKYIKNKIFKDNKKPTWTYNGVPYWINQS